MFIIVREAAGPVAQPQSVGAVQPVLQLWLQTFSWSEEGKVRKMQHRTRASHFAPELVAAPMFCFETVHPPRPHLHTD